MLYYCFTVVPRKSGRLVSRKVSVGFAVVSGLLWCYPAGYPAG